jgi:hypothetical protein
MAVTVDEQLSRLMLNVGGLKINRRKLLNEVVHSILLYGAPVWTDAMRVERMRRKMARV